MWFGLINTVVWTGKVLLVFTKIIYNVSSIKIGCKQTGMFSENVKMVQDICVHCSACEVVWAGKMREQESHSLLTGSPYTCRAWHYLSLFTLFCIEMEGVEEYDAMF